jgi:Ca2+-binding RTX toxin-like protein
VVSLELLYDLEEKQFEISGAADFFYVSAKTSAQFRVTLGTKKDPGLVIKDGVVESFIMSITGEFTLFKLEMQAKGVTVAYNRENQEYAIFGDILLSTAKQGKTQVIKNMKVSLGSSKDKSGIRIVSGSVENVDISLSGDINLFGITASPEKLRVRYSSAENQVRITGGIKVTLAKGLVLQASLPGKGLLINTQTGDVEVRGIRLRSQGDINFGALKIKNLEAFYEDDGGGNVTVGASAIVAMPSGLEVGGSFKIVNGQLDAISIRFQKNPGILVANGIINIYSIEGSVEGLSNLENFKLKATVKATVGPKVSFAGKSHSVADVTGTIIVTPNDLTLEGNVKLVGGLFGNGKFKGVLTWAGTANVKFDAEVRLYPGDIIRGKISAYVDVKGNVDFDAGIGVYVPNQIPVVGGISLGQLTISLRVRPEEPAANSYVRFGFQVLNANGSIKASFDANVRYDFNVEFFLFSVNFGGSFQLRDEDYRPTVRIVSARQTAGTPDGRIVFTGTSDLPAESTVDLYADTDAVGNDGILIGSSIPLGSGNQTFVWNDMSTFAKPGQPIYVYAVVRDDDDQKAYSDYSLPFTVTSGFLPSISAPTTMSFTAGGVTTFTAASGGPIKIDDPRKKIYADSEIMVTLEAGAGILDLPSLPTGVTTSGTGTHTLTLEGRQDDINKALAGLRYVASLDAMFDDTVKVSVISLPLENLDAVVTSTIDMNLSPVTISAIATQTFDGTPATTVFTGDTDNTPLEGIDIDSRYSESLTGVRIQINNYVADSDSLQFSLDDEISTGIDASFDAETGVLILTGFETIEDYESALRQVVFQTDEVRADKSLTISALDDSGGRAEFQVPLVIRKSHEAPEIVFDGSGLIYTQGDGSVAVASATDLVVHDGKNVVRVDLSFARSSYRAGEDVLSYVDPDGPIVGSFNSNTGVLSLTGTGTRADFAAALRSVQYQSTGEVFTPGPRYVAITVTDSGLGHTTGSALQVILKQTETADINAPVLTLSKELVQISAADDVVFLDEELTLESGLPHLVEARVSLSDGYRSGEQSLEVGVLWGNLRARFDEGSGELIISGIATVEEYEEVLRSVLFVDTAADRVGSTLTVSYFVTDGVSEPTSTAMQISIVDAPHLDTRLENVLVYEDGREAVVIDNGLSISFEGQLTGATVQFTGGLQAAEDRLLFDDQNGISGQFNHRTGILKLTGAATVQQYETALESVRYYNARYNPSAGERILEIQVQNGTTFSNSVEALISVEPNVKGPRISLGAGGPVFQEDGEAVRIAPNFDLSAFDATESSTSAALVLHGVEIAVMNYVEGEDLLSFTDTAKINGEWNVEEGILFLYGEATFAEYEAAVRQVRYSVDSDVPDTTPRKIRISLLDSAENGLSRNTLMTQVVRATADRPVKVAGNTNAIYVQQNGEPISLQLGDLRYRAPSSFTESDVEMVVRITEVPAETMGQIVNEDGDALAVGDELPLDDLASLTFEPALGAVGGCDFGFTVHLSDPDSDRLDDASVAESVHIVVNGLATRTASEAFVAQIFRDLTGRDASAKTVKAWSTILNGQLRAAESPQDVDVARAIVVEQIMQSVTARNGQVTQIYQSLLGRLPSTTERAEAMKLLKSGSTLDSLRLTLATSDEYYEASGATSSQYVTALFEDLRGEDGTSEETSRWIAALERGDSRLSVATTILDAENATERNAPEMFQQLLGRPIGEQDNEDYDFYNVNAESLLRRILSSDEYFGRHAVPTSARLSKPRPTSGYAAVGRLGDAAGDKATGTLIAPRFVLVAAHSVADIPPGQLTFTLGNVVYRVTKAWVHPNYDPANTGSDSANDIAILKLAAPVTGVTPAALSTVGVTEGDLLNLVGFGEQDGDEYGTKRRGTTPVVDDVNLNTFRWTVHSAWENDSDPGDSGAPLFLKHDGVEYVAGIVSGGTNLPGRFGDTSLNTRVDSYLSWINEITGLSYGSSVSIKVADASITEGTGGTTPLTFTVTRTGRTDLAASVRYTVETDKTDATDFTGSTASRILRFAADETEKTVTIQVKGDAKWEPLETFRITLSNAVGMSIADASAEVSIRNDDFFALVYSSESQKIVTKVNDAGVLEVRIGSVLQPPVAPDRIGSITINGGDADDSINLTGLSAQKYAHLRSIHLNGGEGDDIIVGAKSFDETISGGLGNDTLHGGTGGFDRIVETAPKGSTDPVQMALTDERLIGAMGRDVIADFESALLIGGAGADTLDGSTFTGRPTLFGLGENDTLKGGLGDDLLRGGAGNDVMSGGGGDDVITGEAGDDRLTGDAGRDILVGGIGRDVLRGGSGEDLLLGDSLSSESNSWTFLRSLQAAWSSVGDIAQRINNMSLGGGQNGISTHIGDAIVKDSTPDSLAGGTDANWFIAEDVDTLFDLEEALGDVLDII